MISSGTPLGLNWRSNRPARVVPGLRLPDPLVTFNFAVEIEGLLVGGFTEVSGLNSQLDTEDYPEGGVNGFVHKLPTRTQPANLTLRHGLTAVSSLWDWYNDVSRGKIKRRNGTILLLNRHQIPLMWWNFSNGLPVQWTGPELNASSDEVGFESIEIAHQGLSKPLSGPAGAALIGLAQLSGG